MDFSFIPKRLQQSREEISLQHKKTKSTPKLVKDDQFRRLIQTLVSLKNRQVKTRAFSLSDTEIDAVASYIPHNYYDVNMKNLFQIFEYRSTERSCCILFDQWQESYKNKECNRFIYSALDDDKYLQAYVQQRHMSIDLFKSILQDDDIPGRLLQEIMHRPYLKGQKLTEKMDFLGIQDGTLLCAECEFQYYVFCEKDDYLIVSKLELLEIVKKYTKRNYGMLKKFLNNFLSKLELKDLQNYQALAEYLQTITGDNATHKKQFNGFFQSFSPVLIQKYIDWTNLFKIERFFGWDERSRFWKQYRFVTVQKYRPSNSIIMEFKNYYAVEFLGRGMGPLYIFPKGYFESKLKYRLNRYDNNQMRQELLHNTNDSERYRKEHRGYWQSDVHNHLIYHRITERLVL